MMATKFTNFAWLTGFDKDAFPKFVDYILGEKVHQLDTNTTTDTAMPHPPWHLVLVALSTVLRVPFAQGCLPAG